jgi:hypothetical protein
VSAEIKTLVPVETMHVISAGAGLLARRSMTQTQPLSMFQWQQQLACSLSNEVSGKAQ